jgi:hypothetical protein
LVCRRRLEIGGVPDLIGVLMLRGTAGITAMDIGDPDLIRLDELGDPPVARVGGIAR